MAEYVLCPFYRKEYDEYILCEMCETYFPSPVKKKKMLEAYCCSNWKACKNAIAITEIYETEGEMFELKKLRFMLKNRSNEVYQMKLFMSKKDKKIQELMNQLATKESYIHRSNERITRAEMEARVLRDKLDAVTRMIGYLALKYKIGKVSLVAIKKFGEHYNYRFDFPKDIAVAVSGKRKVEEKDYILIVVTEKEIQDAYKGFTATLPSTSERKDVEGEAGPGGDKPEPKVS